MIPYGRQYIDRQDIKSVVNVLKSNWLTQGPEVFKFEKALAESCKAKYAVATSNGTAALHLAYLAAGLKKDDEIITTGNTFVATTNMMLAVGAKPVFCDIRTDTSNIDASKIEVLITPKTKVIVPVHFAGHPCEMDRIIKIAKKHKLLVVEDACHALGASYKKRPIGGISDMTVFSFHPVKSITTGEGGAILTNNKNFYEKLLHLRSHGIKKDKNGFNVMSELGFNYRLTDLQAALGLSQLKKLSKFVSQRQKIVSWYKKELADSKEIVLPAELPNSYSSWHIYVIKTKSEADRKPLAEYLKASGINTNFHYPAVYSHPHYKKIGYADVSLTNTDNHHKTCLTLPCYTTLKHGEVKFISQKIKEFFKNHES